MQQLVFILLFSVGSLFFLVVGLLIGRKLFSKNTPLSNTENSPAEINTTEQTEQVSPEKLMLESILKNIEEGTIVTDVNGIILWANQKSLEILKTSWVMANNNHINKILPMTSEESQKSVFKLKLTSFEGATIFVSVKVYPLIDKDREAKGKIYVIWDATESMALEEMKLDFVAIATHQLRTPLTSIRGYLSILSESILPKMNDEERKFFQRVIISSDRLASLIANLMNISQIEKGTLIVDFKPIHLEEVINETVGLLLDTAKESNVQLLVSNLVPPSPEIMGDANLLGIALSNIIANGIKYNHPGGQVQILLQKQSDGLTIHITDNGKGIPALAQEHLFQRFYQATSSLSELSNGLGLGLYTSKAIIDAHKGKISINSLEGKGTTVSIFLPGIINNS